MKNILSLLALIFILTGCSAEGPRATQVEARVTLPSIVTDPGLHKLGLGGLLRVNRSMSWRDGKLYIPASAKSGEPMPLLVWLHGGGGRAKDFVHFYAVAEEHGVVLLNIDARHNTWDGIDSPFGPDVLFINEALQHTFERVSINLEKIALGGLSDGASYSLALGRSNGELFTHLIAAAPGGLRPPAPLVGKPKILVVHGIQDNVYGVSWSRNHVVPGLREAGYDVSYIEFDGPHWVPTPVAHKIMDWIVN